MMQAFRNAAKPVIYVLTIAFFVWLVYDLSGLGSGNNGILRKTSVGKINGRSIDVRVFDQRVQNALNEAQQRGNPTTGLDEVQEVRNRVWDQVIQEVLLQGEFGKRGIQVSNDEVAEAIRNLPIPELQQLPELQTNGKFDPEKYQRWLASSVGQSIIPGLEAQYREQLLQAKLFRSVVSDVFLSDATLWERYRDEREQVKVGLARLDPVTAINDQSASVTPQEAEAYYNQHRDDFKRTHSAFLSYLTVPRQPNATDTAAALQRANSIRDEIQKGAPFDEVAKRESADSQSAKAGGSLGEMKKSAVVPEFGNAVMTLPLNTVSEPVKTAFGFHIIKVESRKGDSFTARHILVPVEITGDHRDQLDKVADSLQSLAAEKPDRAALDTAARALKLTIKHVGPVTEGSRVFVPEGGMVPDAGVWAFQAKPGEQSSVIESPNAFFVFRLDSLQNEGIPDFASVKSEVENKVRLGKKVAQAKKLGETLVQQVSGGTPLSQGSKTLGFDYRELGPFARLNSPLPSPVLLGAAFGLKSGQVSAPIDASEGKLEADLGIYVLQVIERTPVDSADFVKNLPTIRGQALQNARRSRVQAYMTALRENAKIADYRKDIYKSAAQQAAVNQ